MLRLRFPSYPEISYDPNRVPALLEKKEGSREAVRLMLGKKESSREAVRLMLGKKGSSREAVRLLLEKKKYRLEV